MTQTRSRSAAPPPSRGQRYRTTLRSTLRSIAERDRFVGARLVRGWRLAKRWWIRRSLLRSVGLDQTAAAKGILEPLWVRPDKVVFCSGLEFPLLHYRDAVVAGDWDLSDKVFESLDVYEAIRDVLRDGTSTWEDTAWYADVVGRISKGSVLWGCRSRDEFLRRLQFIESLYASMADEGYLMQRQLAERGDEFVTGYEIGIAIGRTGRLLFCDGAHRLAVAKLLGIEAIPVQVAVRHPDWDRFRTELAEYARRSGGTLYQPALHPDLARIPAQHTCEDRWSVLAPFFTGPSRSVLDIGANLGFFSNRLEDFGHRCTAIESDPILAYFAKVIRDANGHSFEIVNSSVLGGSLRGRTFQSVLALNVFHHFLKTKRDLELLERLLATLRCEDLFFEPHSENEAQMVGAYAPLSPSEFVEMVADKSGLTDIEYLATTGDGRRLYRLRRPGGTGPSVATRPAFGCGGSQDSTHSPEC